jgi:cytochrome c peroxidase
MKRLAQRHAPRALQPLVVGLLLVCTSMRARPAVDDKARLAFAADPTVTPPDPNRVALGRLLFHDSRLSRNREISCSTCHGLSRFGIDAKPISIGIGGILGKRNAPSVFNAAAQIAQFWDGRAGDLEAEAISQILSPFDMAMPSEKALVKELSRVPAYVQLFRKAFPGDHHAVSLKNVGQAIGAFESVLVTKSRWESFIAGDQSALTARERDGLRVFRQRGCIVCHAGPRVGGSTFQKLGAAIPWPNQSDQGRVEVTKYPPDSMVFKVPSLKNVAETAPYFHDGSTPHLDEAIKLMGRHQLGIEMADDDIRAIADWMQSLTGAADPGYLATPTLPPG